MTAKELIAQLQLQDPEMPVGVYWERTDTVEEITNLVIVDEQEYNDASMRTGKNVIELQIYGLKQ